MSIQGARALSAELEALLEDYRWWLVTERSLVPSTVQSRVRVARLFLGQWDGSDLKSLSISDVVGFVVDQSSRLAVKTTKTRITDLRSLLGYLYLKGITDRPL